MMGTGKIQQYSLSNEGVDQISSEISSYLTEMAMNHRDILRVRLMMEELLLQYRERIGGEQKVLLFCGKRRFRSCVRIILEGESFNPFSDEVESRGVLSTFLANMGLCPSWSYQNGRNILLFVPPKVQKCSPLLQMTLVLGLAVVLGLLCRMLPVSVSSFMTDELLTPLLNTFTGLLSAVSGPLVFLSVLWGIAGMGDIATFGRIGKKMISRFLLMSTLLLLIAGAVILPFFSVSAGEGGSLQFSALYAMILDIVPSNLFTPFTEGNPMQIIFVAVIVGLSILVLGDKAEMVSRFVEQVNSIVQLIMQQLSSVILVFVFGSVFHMILSGKLEILFRSVKLPLLMVFGCLAIAAFYLVLVSVHKKVSPLLLLKKTFPTFLIGFSTASSAAAFSTNTEACEKKLGIDRQLINLGVPFGQVVFMPGAAVLFFCVGICLAETYSVAITVSWLFTLFLLVLIIAIAAPPVPGGALTCYTILICGLNLPAEAITIAVAMNVVMEFVATGVNLFCLQLDLVELAGSLKMLDEKTLHMK